MDEFNDYLWLVEEFKIRGYEVDSQYIPKSSEDKFFKIDKSYMSCQIKDKNIRVWFTTKNEDTHPNINGYIGIDREDCFNKWSDVPIVLPIPQTSEQIKFIFDKIDWLLTAKGFKVSNEYRYKQYVTSY